MTSIRINEIISEVDAYIENYSEGDDCYRIMLSSSEKSLLDDHLKNDPKCKGFHIVNGISRPGLLEKPYYIKHVI